MRSGAAVGLINPFAALIPLIAPSNNKPLPCNRMLANIRKAPTAPPAGQKQKAKAAPAYMSSDAAASGADAQGVGNATKKPEAPVGASAAQYRGS